MFNVDYNGQKGNKHLQFLSQAAPSAEKHHVIGDWEVTRQSGATLNYSGVDSIQTLVAKKRVVPPVFLDIIWKKKATVFALHHDLSLPPRHHSGWGYNKNISQCFCVIVVLNMSVDCINVGPVLLAIRESFQLELCQPGAHQVQKTAHTTSL